VYELTYQFLIITVLGSAVTWLYKELDRIRGQRIVLSEMHSELLQAYNRAKQIRRSMRAHLGTKKSVDLTTPVTAEMYKEKVENLSEVQLVFEVYAKRAEDDYLFFWRGAELARALRKIEAYLNRIVGEYERELKKFEGEPPVRTLANLQSLAEFVGPHEAGEEFQKCFQKPMRVALKTLGRSILR
jgi:hypothetical protein